MYPKHQASLSEAEEGRRKMINQDSYSLRFSVDYPERLSRLTTAFRLILMIPVVVVLRVLNGPLFVPPLLMILFRRKYPRWWFDFNLELFRFSMRTAAYTSLLTDQYPSTDEQQSVHSEIDYPDAQRDLNRLLPLVKWFLAIPHLIVLFFLGIASIVAVVIAWFAILLTGRYPRGLFDFVVGVTRWSNRVTAYCLFLVTDRYPPFSLT